MPVKDAKKPAGKGAVIEQLQAQLDSLLSQKHVKHAIVAVESGDRSLRWIGAAGEANPDGTLMHEDTPFFIASVTKLYIAVVILKLHERGLLHLDKPISRYLPQSLISGIHRMGGVDYTNAITIQHLLSHTSGLADWLEDRPKGGESLIEQLFRGGDRALRIEDVTQIIRDQLSPHFPPQPLEAKGNKTRYSDTNFQLLIAIIETLHEKPLHQVFDEQLFRPLNLRHTFHPGQAPLEATSEPATVWVESQPLVLPMAMQSFGDLYSTAADLLAFLRALTRAEVFDYPTTLSLMQQRWNRFGFPLDAAALRSPGWPIEYGLGLMRFRLPRAFTLPYSIPAVIGHTGSTGTWLFFCPELDVYLCGSVDQATAGAVPFRFVPKLLRILASTAR